MGTEQTIALLKAGSAGGGGANSVLAPEPPSPELSPMRVLLFLIVLCGIGFGVWTLVTRQTSLSRRQVARRAGLRAVRRCHAHAHVPVSASGGGPGLQRVPRIHRQRPRLRLHAELGRLLHASPSRPDAQPASADRPAAGAGVAAPSCRSAAATTASSPSAATGPTQLTQAYRQAIEHYGVSEVDFDIEGAALGDLTANTRRAQAIASIQRQMVIAHRTLRVWLTLPVSDHGLTSQGVAVVRSMLAAHVTIAGGQRVDDGLRGRRRRPAQSVPDDPQGALRHPCAGPGAPARGGPAQLRGA